MVASGCRLSAQGIQGGPTPPAPKTSKFPEPLVPLGQPAGWVWPGQGGGGPWADTSNPVGWWRCRFSSRVRNFTMEVPQPGNSPGSGAEGAAGQREGAHRIRGFYSQHLSRTPPLLTGSVPGGGVSPRVHSRFQPSPGPQASEEHLPILIPSLQVLTLPDRVQVPQLPGAGSGCCGGNGGGGRVEEGLRDRRALHSLLRARSGERAWAGELDMCVSGASATTLLCWCQQTALAHCDTFPSSLSLPLG